MDSSKKLYLYLLEPTLLTVFNSNVYEKCVVAAEDAEEARKINPAGWWGPRSWPRTPGEVDVTYLGEAGPEVERGVICSSYVGG